MNKIKKIIFFYINNFIIIDLLLLVSLFVILYYYFKQDYFEVHEIFILFIGFPAFGIWTNSEKINKLKSQKWYWKIVIIYVIYSILFSLMILILKNNIKNLNEVVLNTFISLLIVSFLRLLIFSILSFILYLKSKTK